MQFKARRILSVASPLPIAVASDRSRAGATFLATILHRGYDVIVCDFPHTAVLLPSVLNSASVLFTHNVEAEILQRHAEVTPGALMQWIWRSQARKMASYEDDVAKRFDVVVAVSQRDVRHFRSVVDGARVLGIPTGVDLEYFFAAPEPEAPGPHNGTLVFTGSMDWPANRDGIRYMLDAIWPSIVAVRPEAELVVVGHSPPRDLLESVRSRGLRVRFTGFVDDVRLQVHAAHVYVIPLRVGGGTRIKAFEAMAMGRPVVSTSIGVESLPVEHDRHLLVADDPVGFARAVLRLLDDGVLRAKLAQSARGLVETNYSFHTASRVFEDACLSAMACAGLRRPLAEQARLTA